MITSTFCNDVVLIVFLIFVVVVESIQVSLLGAVGRTAATRRSATPNDDRWNR
jgi:hypothetical protein